MTFTDHRRRLRTLGATALVAVVAVGAIPRRADAFCGFYVSGSGAKLSNDATQVVLMRQGTRTVLAMQNAYKGPLEDFAMVVPVPVVLKETEVKTLPRAVFDRIDQLGAPRLVEYWEQDPCPQPMKYRMRPSSRMEMSRVAPAPMDARKQHPPKVVIEAKFDVAEYKILILSATEAAGLETWLADNGYKIPAGAEPLLRPYVESGSKFFVAKVDPKKVQLGADQRAALSPLRFHYDSEDFSLPIRLGMANSTGKQDLIINILSADKRYEVANYKNVFIPTNFDVKAAVRPRFAEFYAALFDKTVEKHPGAVVTEYAWTAQPQLKCDPCPDQVPNDADMMTLGADLVGGRIAQGYYVLTRLHARYGKADMKDDLRFREAKPVVGGREAWSRDGIEYGAKPGSSNFFQGRYAIRNPWTGPVACQNPRRGVWGGPPHDHGGSSNTIAASKTAFAPRGKLKLPDMIRRDLWELGIKRTVAPSPKSTKSPTPTPPPPPKASGGFAKPPGAKPMFFGLGMLGALSALGIGASLRRKRS